MLAIKLVLCPATQPGTYWPMLDGRRLTKATRQPFFDGARALLSEGVDPDAGLLAFHAGSPTIALQSTVGEAARWSVSEPDRGKCTRIPYAPYKPDSRSTVASSGDEDGVEAITSPPMPHGGISEPYVAATTSPITTKTVDLRPLPVADCQDEHPRGISHDIASKIVADFGSAQSDFGRRLVPRYMPPVDPTIEAEDVA